ncbi:MAG: hypothetical protein S4CHLAM6_12410 [Chlamydiae bacterium]|nr:hypothetical protein [Chlamydiota bacterium]
MTFKYGFTVVPVLADILHAPPIIRAGAHFCNFAANFFPRVLSIGNSKLGDVAEQNKLARIQSIVDDLKDELGMKEMQVEVRVSPHLKHRISYLGNSKSSNGALLLVGQKAFDEFESEKIVKSPLYEKWQAELKNIPDVPLEIIDYLKTLSETKKQAIIDLAKKFEHIYTEKEFKAVLARELSNINESHQLLQTGFAAHNLALFSILRTILPYAIPAAFYLKETLSRLDPDKANLLTFFAHSSAPTVALVAIDITKYLNSSIGILGANFFAFRRISKSIKNESQDSELVCFKTKETHEGILEHYKKLLFLHPDPLLKGVKTTKKYVLFEKEKKHKGSFFNQRFNLWRNKHPLQEKVEDEKSQETPSEKTPTNTALAVNIYKKILSVTRPVSSLEQIIYSNRTYLAWMGGIRTSYQILNNLTQLNPYTSRLMSQVARVFYSLIA